MATTVKHLDIPSEADRETVRAYIFVITLLVLIFGSIATYKYLEFSALASASFERPPVTIASAIADLETWEKYIEAVGTIKAVRGINLASEESGELIEVNFASGDAVEAGELLIVLNDRVEIARKDSQEATLELARLQFERNKKLMIQNSISKSEYDISKADLERAMANLAETEATLDNKRIRAPFSGITGIRQVELGNYVSPGTTLVTLQDLTELDIDFTLPAQTAPLLAPGQRIELTVDAFPNRPFQARLLALDSQIDPNTRNLMARARILDGQGLLPGMFAYLRLFPGTAEEIITVPETAVTYSLHGNIVYVIKPGEADSLIALPAVVEVGETREGRTQISSGIKKDDQVVAAGQNKLYRGARIVIDEDVSF